MAMNYPSPGGGMAASTPGGVSPLGVSAVTDGADSGHKAFLSALLAAGRRNYFNGETDGTAPVNAAHASSGGTQGL